MRYRGSPAANRCELRGTARELVYLPANLLPSTVMATPGKAARNARPAGEPTLLTSRDNRWLKEFRMALRGGLPTENGFVGVEGARLVEEALRSGCRIHAVLFSESRKRRHHPAHRRRLWGHRSGHRRFRHQRHG